MKQLFVGIFFLVIGNIVMAQNNTVIKVLNAADKLPIETATVNVKNSGSVKTNNEGIAITKLTLGGYKLSISSVGFITLDTTITIPSADTITVLLKEISKNLEEVTVVSSTRNNQRIENAALKVEVLGSEEMAEESVIKPAGIASILGDVSGVQIQQSSATTGNVNVRMQGLDGRYTQLLKDGLPLFDGFSGGFKSNGGILKIPKPPLKPSNNGNPSFNNCVYRPSKPCIRTFTLPVVALLC